MSKTKDRIRDSQLRYKQGLGQNFLYDDDLPASLAELSGVGPEDDVLEIGPGAGTLTRQLCRKAHHVTTVELDERLIPLLQAFLHDAGNLTVVQGDIMETDLAALTAGMRKPFRVVANIPYYITTPLITRLLESGLPMSSLALMVQKEVADKLLSAPGQDGWGLLAAKAQYYTEPALLMDVPAACFTPPPKVDSAFVLLPLRETPAAQPKDEALFFRVMGAAFALRRKTMLNSLAAVLGLPRETALAALAKAGLDDKIRGEKLTLAQLAALSDAIGEGKEPS